MLTWSSRSACTSLPAVAGQRVPMPPATGPLDRPTIGVPSILHAETEANLSANKMDTVRDILMLIKGASRKVRFIFLMK